MQNLQIIKVTSCYLPESIYFEFATNSYILILLIFLFILSLLSASVPSANFRREGVVTYKAVVIALLPTPLIFLLRIGILLSQRPELFVAQLWAEFCWTSLLPFILLVVLFAPTVSIIIIVAQIAAWFACMAYSNASYWEQISRLDTFCDGCTQSCMLIGLYDIPR